MWVKQLSRVVGVEVHAVTIALSAFFAGLAVGAAVFGRLADRTSRPARVYAALEGGAAVAGIAATIALARMPATFVALQDTVGAAAWLLPCVAVAIPAFLIGGTMPAMLRAVHPGGHGASTVTGLLYSANTIGAVCGILATAFLLVPLFGLTGTVIVASLLQLTVAVITVVLPWGAMPAATARQQPSNTSSQKVALLLYGGAGAIAMGYEVVWAELLVQYLSTRTYAFAVMLSTYLAGLAIGSWLWARRPRGRGNEWSAFGLLIAGAGISALLIVLLLGDWVGDAQTTFGTWAMRVTGRETVEVSARFIVAAAAVIFIPTLLLGAAFPAVSRLTVSGASVAGAIGITLAVNTVGGIAGTLVTGLLLVPWLGLVHSLAVLAVGAAVIGATAIRQGTRSIVVPAGLVALTVVAAVTAPADKLARQLAEQRGGQLKFYEEGAGGTVAVLEQSTPAGPFRRLYIQGVSNSGDTMASQRYMRLQALLPLLLHNGEPRSALVVGLGTGITAGALLAEPSLDTRVVAELLPAVVRALPHFDGNMQLHSNPGVQIRIGDGRHELLRRDDRFDLITLEPPPPSAAGVSNLYSRDFYELCRDRLKPGGLMAQWWPLPAQNDEDSRSLVRSFLDAFPHVSLWTTELHEMLLIGSMTPLLIDGPRVATRFARPETAAALSAVGVESAAALLATWITDRRGLEHYASDASPVTDDRPTIEHGAWVRRGEFDRVLPLILKLAAEVPLSPDDPLRPEVEVERRELLDFYDFALRVNARDRQSASILLKKVLSRDPANPYYRWMIGRSN